MKKQILLSMLMAATVSAQAQSRLEPMTQIQQKLWGERYFGKWLSKEASQQMLKFPTPMQAFPSALYVFSDKGEIARLQAKWCVVKKNATPNESKLRVDSMEVKTDRATALMFSDLIEHAVATCMFNDTRMGYDGTRYFFGDYIRIATIWSPSRNSNCRRLTDVLEKAMTAVRQQDEDALKALLPEVESLTKVFESLYPDDSPQPSSEGLGIKDSSTPASGQKRPFGLSEGLGILRLRSGRSTTKEALAITGTQESRAKS